MWVGDVLDPAFDAVRPSAVMPRLSGLPAGPVAGTAAIGSTNDEAARGGHEGTVVGSDHQTPARGRRGRPWVDAPGEALMDTVVPTTEGQPNGRGRAAAAGHGGAGRRV